MLRLGFFAFGYAFKLTLSCALSAFWAHSGPIAGFAARPRQRCRSHGVNASSVANAAIVCR